MTARSFTTRDSTAAELAAAGLDVDDVARTIRAALDEDLRHGTDTTTEAIVPADATATAEVTPRSDGVLSGVALVLSVLDAMLGDDYEILDRKRDGEPLIAGHPALVVRGPARGLLTAERTALNLLCHASGIATLTAHWVAATTGTDCAIRDSRKTLPGLRTIEKYAVRCGGGVNHRMSLSDAILIKDNHIAAAGSLSAAIVAARRAAPGLPHEVEIDDLDQLDEALALDVDEILLDNLPAPACAEAVRRRDAAHVPTRLEASGGLRLADAPAYAATGIDYLAVGALTHSAPTLDIGIDHR